MSRHEAGHATASLLHGRLIEYAVVDGDAHEVQNVPIAQNRIPMQHEAVILASGWAAEERYFRLTGLREDDIEYGRLFGGHRDDWDKLDWLDKRGLADADAALSRAEGLAAEHWDLIEVVANVLLAEKRIGQERLEEVCSLHGVVFGDAAGSDGAE